MFDPELQNMKKEARRVLCDLKRQRRAGADVTGLYAQYSEIRKAAKCRLKMKTQSMVKEVERLNDTDAKTGINYILNI